MSHKYNDAGKIYIILYIEENEYNDNIVLIISYNLLIIIKNRSGNCNPENVILLLIQLGLN